VTGDSCSWPRSTAPSTAQHVVLHCAWPSPQKRAAAHSSDMAHPNLYPEPNPILKSDLNSTGNAHFDLLPGSGYTDGHRHGAAAVVEDQVTSATSTPVESPLQGPHQSSHHCKAHTSRATNTRATPYHRRTAVLAGSTFCQKTAAPAGCVPPHHITPNYLRQTAAAAGCALSCWEKTLAGPTLLDQREAAARPILLLSLNTSRQSLNSLLISLHQDSRKSKTAASARRRLSRGAVAWARRGDMHIRMHLCCLSGVQDMAGAAGMGGSNHPGSSAWPPVQADIDARQGCGTCTGSTYPVSITPPDARVATGGSKAIIVGCPLHEAGVTSWSSGSPTHGARV